MFIFVVQLIDFIQLHVVQLFLVFYILTFLMLGTRLFFASRYTGAPRGRAPLPTGISVVLPVFNESKEVLGRVIDALLVALKHTGLPHEVLIVENGSSLYTDALHEDTDVVSYFNLEEPSKRKAIAYGVAIAKYPITVLLDSDTEATPESITKLLAAFTDPKVGGVVPRQEVKNATQSIIACLCNWYEEIRFGNTTPGLSFFGQVPCLVGRLYAIRTHILAENIKDRPQDFVDQRVFGKRLEIGDDRVITSIILKAGYKTVYDSDALVYTYAPNTLWGFVKQRLRWSRSSFRETILSTPWLWRFPYAFLIMWSDIVLRWLFFAVIATFVWALATGNLATHFLDLPLKVYIAGGIIGFLVSGWIKQLPHLSRVPGDLGFTPLFLLLTTLVPTPVEWYGNLTCLKTKWLTRK